MKILLLVQTLLFMVLSAAAAAEIEALEEQAMREAVARVAPSVVRLETIGGLEKVGRVLVGTGPTTGLVVSEDGYILSSAFNFVQRPSSILVTLPGGTRAPAQVVATDHSRMLVLLKIEADEKLPVPEFVAEEDMSVGQWALAVGRTFDASEPNVSVGIVSALGRMFGRAVQTDAKISPSNYGGPLVDIHGRVLGMLVPMSPQGSDEVAGVEWYDAGIGFAVPLPRVYQKLPQLKAGEDLHPGILGVGLKKANPFSEPAEIAAAQPNAPAAKAGLKAGDRIVELDGRPIETQMHLKLALGPRYAGETVRVVALRGAQRRDFEVELTDELEPFAHAFLGVLPKRPVTKNAEAGVEVRYVYPDSPAANAGILIGDRIIDLAGKPVKAHSDAVETLAAIVPGEEISLRLKRGDEEQSLKLTTDRLPSDIPGELTPAHAAPPKFAGNRPQVGQFELKLPELKNTSQIYVPEDYHPDLSYGVVVWLHGSGGDKDGEVAARWQPFCRLHDLILVSPQAQDPLKWQPTEAEFIVKLLAQVAETYHVDPSRVVVHGFQSGGAMAYLVALQNRDRVGGAAVVDAPMPRRLQVPSNEPVNRLAIYIAHSDEARFAERIENDVRSLRQAEYPVTTKRLGGVRYLDNDELAELVRWVDTLDRL